MTSAAHTPKPLTYAEYALIPADGRVWELIDGDFHVNPAPVSFHQTVSRRLQYRLMSLLEETGVALVFNAPTDVVLAHTTTVQPDLAIIALARKSIVSKRGIEGPPDIVVEILSASNRSYDEVLKRSLYERSGVAEFWIVDPEAKSIEVLGLTSKGYVRRALFVEDDVLTSEAFAGLIHVPIAPLFVAL